MWIDLTPLKNNRDYRYLYCGQFVSFFGTMLSFVAMPYQMYQLTHSSLAVGLLGVIELIPLLITAFVGGALADVMDRKKLLLSAEFGMAIAISILVANALLASPAVWVLYLMAGILSALNGIHRPSLDAMIPRLVEHHEIQAASILRMFQSTMGMVGGMAASGILISTVGMAWTFVIDGFTFVVSMLAISQIKSMKPLVEVERPSLKSIREAFQYAWQRQELLGTYVADFVALVFSMPNALFPALSQQFGGPKTVGWLYSALPMGALVVTVFSGWAKHVKRHGAAVICAAFLWGLSIVIFGAMEHFLFALLFLGSAGAADGVSGIFRTTIWNETIPDRIRGRMASLEMIGYMSGPLLGNAQAGLMASITGTQNAIMIGGTLCMIGVVLCALLLPRFWQYRQVPLNGK